MALDPQPPRPQGQVASKINSTADAQINPDVRLAAGPTAPASPPLVLALEALMADRPGEAVQHLKGYDPKDQELLLRLLPIVAKAARGGVMTNRLTNEEKVALLETLAPLTAELRVSAPLVIEDLLFCRKVTSFGKVDPLPTNQFRPGDQVSIYAEVRNLTDRRLPDDQYAVNLASTLEIRSADCRVVRGLPVRGGLDRSRSPRTDHFIWIHFQVPRDLEPGVYTLRVRVVDQDTRREADKCLGFRVVGDLTP